MFCWQFLFLFVRAYQHFQSPSNISESTFFVVYATVPLVSPVEGFEHMQCIVFYCLCLLCRFDFLAFVAKCDRKYVLLVVFVCCAFHFIRSWLAIRYDFLGLLWQLAKLYDCWKSLYKLAFNFAFRLSQSSSKSTAFPLQLRTNCQDEIRIET